MRMGRDVGTDEEISLYYKFRNIIKSVTGRKNGSQGSQLGQKVEGGPPCHISRSLNWLFDLFNFLLQLFMKIINKLFLKISHKHGKLTMLILHMFYCN